MAAAALVIVAGVASFAWWDARQAESQARIEGEHVAAAQQARERTPELIAIAAGLRRTYQFEEAKRTLPQAAELATTAGLDDLQPVVAPAQADLAFVAERDDIRMKRSAVSFGVGAGIPPVAHVPGSPKTKVTPRASTPSRSARDGLRPPRCGRSGSDDSFQ